MTRLLFLLEALLDDRDQDGFSTAELLGNAALGIAALVAIWVVLGQLGVNVVSWIGAQLNIG